MEKRSGGRLAVYLVLILLVLAAGVLVVWRAGAVAVAVMKEQLLRQAVAVAEALPPEDFSRLSFGPADLQNAVYRRMSAQMAAYARSAGVRSLYTMVLRDGKILFGPESLTEDDPVSSPPGTVYLQPSQADFEIFDNAVPLIQGPERDEYGVFVTALAPVRDPVHHRVVAVAGIDVEAGEWDRRVRESQKIPAIMTGLLLIVLIGGVAGQQLRNSLAPSQARRCRQIERLFAVLFILLLSVALSIRFYFGALRLQSASFDAFARARTGSLLQRFRDLDQILGQMSAFFRSSQTVTAGEFRDFCMTVRRSPVVKNCFWICESRNSRSGEIDPGEYRVVYRDPVETTDWSMDAGGREALQSALYSGLHTSAIIGQEPDQRRLFLFAPAESGEQRGVVSIEVDLAALSGVCLQAKSCRASLFALDPGRQPVALTGGMDAGLKSRTSGALVLEVPLFVAGRSFLFQMQSFGVPGTESPVSGAVRGLATGLLISWAGVAATVFFLRRRGVLVRELDESEAGRQVEEQRFRDAAYNTGDLLWETDAEGRYSYLSDRSFGLLGYTPRQMIGRPPADFLDPDQPDGLTPCLNPGGETGQPFRDCVSWKICRDGRKVCFRSNAVPVFDAKGLFCGYRGADADITAARSAEQELFLTEERFRLISAISRTGVWEYCASGQRLRCSPEYFSMLGYQPGEIPPDHNGNLTGSWVDLLHPDDRQRALRTFAGYLESQASGFYENRFRMRHKDGSWVYILSRGQTLRNPDGSFSDLTVGTHIDISEQVSAEARIRQLVQHQEQSREEERRRFSRELHDDIGQILTALKIDLMRVREQLTPSGEAAGMLDDMSRLLQDGIRSVHSLCHRLRPGALDDLGLDEALLSLIQDWKNRNHIRCDLFFDVEDAKLSDAIRTAVFRLVQEALTNVSKYAGASGVDICLVADEETLNVTVADDGRGMEAGAANKPASFGLLGMRERIQALHGELQIESSPGKGTRIDVSIPLQIPPDPGPAEARRSA